MAKGVKGVHFPSQLERASCHSIRCYKLEDVFTCLPVMTIFPTSKLAHDAQPLQLYLMLASLFHLCTCKGFASDPPLSLEPSTCNATMDSPSSFAVAAWLCCHDFSLASYSAFSVT